MWWTGKGLAGMSENWCALCAAKDQEIADLKRKTQSADEQLLELRNAATEAAENWNSWERSCEQKEAEIADLKAKYETELVTSKHNYDKVNQLLDENGNLRRQLASSTSLLGSVEGSEETYVDRIAELERQLAKSRKDTERLDWLERETGNAIYDTRSTTYKVTFRVGQGAFVSDCGSLRGAIDAAREGKSCKHNAFTRGICDDCGADLRAAREGK